MNKMTKKHNKKQLVGTPNNSKKTAITSQLPKQPPITLPAALKTLLERYKRGDVV